MDSGKTFVHLHNHSTHSLLDGASKPADMAKRAAELGQPAMAITDHGRMSGVLEFYSACLDNGVKPIIGLEAYIMPLGHSRFERERYAIKEFYGKPGYVRNYYHLILLAKDMTGFQSLSKLSTCSFSEGYYYKPRIDFELLAEHSDGLICQSACILGEVNNLLWCGDYEKAKQVAQSYQSVFGDDYFLEIMNHDLAMEKSIMAPIRQLSSELSIPVVATNDTHMVRKQDAKLQKTLMMLGMGKSWSDPDVKGSFFDDDDGRQSAKIEDESGDSDPIFDMPASLYIKDYDEMVAALRPEGGDNGVAEAELAMSLEIASRCNCELPIIDPDDVSQYHMPVYDIKKDVQYDDYIASDFELRDDTVNAIVKEMKDDGLEGEELEDFMSQHEIESLKFLMWMCEKGLNERIRPKIEALGEPLPMEFWCKNPPEGFVIEHLHNSPDEIWIKRQLSEGKTPKDIIQIYYDRLDYETSIVTSKRFLAYFLIVQCYCNYTRYKKSYVGPGRGSGCGSLLNSLTGITSTAVDPITNDLLFSRFIAKSRRGFPDIDCDFVKEFRDEELKPYLCENFGKENACAVATYMILWGKAALRAAGRVLFHPPLNIQIADDFCNVIDDQPKLDLRTQMADGVNPAFMQVAQKSREHKQVLDLALILQGYVSGESIHASAFILSPEPITDKLPLSVSKEEREKAQKSGKPVENLLCQFSGTELGDLLGYVKLDLLCIKDLEMVARSLNTIKRIYGCDIDIEQIPLDDAAVFRMLQEGHNAGIFQFDGSPVAGRLLIESGADCISDWAAINALNRPGPLQMGYDRDFVEGKKHPDKIRYFTPEAEPILRDTYGATIYQESLMLLSQVKSIVGFDGSQADHMRKCCAKKKKDQLAALREEISEVASSNGVAPEVYNEFADIAIAAGSYSFNKSHALAYAVIAYMDAFIKAHFPDAFLASMCTIKPQMKKVNKIPSYVAEARQMGVTVKPPHVNYSMAEFDVPERGVIAFGLGGIKKVGKAAETIIAEREENGTFSDFTDFCCRCPKSVGKGPLEALIKAGALDGLGWSRMAMEESIEDIIAFRKKWFEEKEKLSVLEDSLFGSAWEDELPQVSLVAPFDTEYTDRQILRKEYEIFECYFSGNPEDYTSLSRFQLEKRLKAEAKEAKKKGDYEHPEFINISQIGEFENKEKVEFIASVSSAKGFFTKSGKRMGNIRLHDWGIREESRFGFAPIDYHLKCTCFSKTWNSMTPVVPDDVVHVIGSIDIDPTGKWPTAILVDFIETLPQDKDLITNGDVEELAKLQEEMLAERKQWNNPASDAYMIPAIVFPTIDDLESFEFDPETATRFSLQTGRVQLSVEGDANGEYTRIAALRQTRGMVAHAARYRGIAHKIRLPKAASAITRMEMMGTAPDSSKNKKM